MNKKLILSNSLYTAGISLFLSSYVAYWFTNGVSEMQISILDMVFLVVSMLFEIPSGIISDLYGRKLSYIFSATIRGFALLSIGIGLSFPGLAIAIAITAIGEAFHSGAFEAWLIETSEKSDFSRVYRIISIATTIISIIFGFIGGSIYNLFPSSVWIFSGSLLIFSAISASFINEKNKKDRFSKYKIKKYIKITFYIWRRHVLSIKNTNRNISAIIAIIIISSEAFGDSGLGLYWQIMVIDQEKHLTLGVMWVAMQITSLLGSISSKFLSKSNYSGLYLLITSVSIVAILPIFLDQLMVSIMFLLHIFLLSICMPNVWGEVNKIIPDKIRSSSLSAISLLSSFLTMIGITLSGVLSSYFSIKIAVAAPALMSLIPLVASVLFLLVRQTNRNAV